MSALDAMMGLGYPVSATLANNAQMSALNQGAVNANTANFGMINGQYAYPTPPMFGEPSGGGSFYGGDKFGAGPSVFDTGAPPVPYTQSQDLFGGPSSYAAPTSTGLMSGGFSGRDSIASALMGSRNMAVPSAAINSGSYSPPPVPTGTSMWDTPMPQAPAPPAPSQQVDFPQPPPIGQSPMTTRVEPRITDYAPFGGPAPAAPNDGVSFTPNTENLWMPSHFGVRDTGRMGGLAAMPFSGTAGPMPTAPPPPPDTGGGSFTFTDPGAPSPPPPPPMSPPVSMQNFPSVLDRFQRSMPTPGGGFSPPAPAIPPAPMPTPSSGGDVTGGGSAAGPLPSFATRWSDTAGMRSFDPSSYINNQMGGANTLNPSDLSIPYRGR